MKKLCLIILLFINLIYCKPLSVLFVTGSFPYQPRQYIDNQIAGFIDAGADVHVFASKGSMHEEYALAQKYKFKDITFYNELPEDQRSYDIIYCQFGDNGPKILDMRKEGYIKGIVVICIRSGKEIEYIKTKANQYKTFFADVDLLLPVCEAFKNDLIDLGCPPEKIFVHHSAIDVKQFEYKKRTISRDAIKLVTVGRLIQGKGHQYSIEAIKYLKIKYPNITFDIYGSGHKYKILQKMIEECQLENNVFLKGYCDHDVLQAILDHYDIFIITSYERGLRKEGIPNALMETMAMGFPVIGTRHSGIPELIEDNISGFLIPEKDSAATAEKIDYVINHPELWEAFGKAARKKVLKEHCKEKQNKKLIKLFNKLKKSHNQNLLN